MKPHHLVRLLGVGVALFTFGSYLAPFIFDFDDDEVVTRQVFENIPDAFKLAFYTVIPLLLIIGAWEFSNRVKNWQRGRPDNRRTTLKNAKKRAETSGPVSTCRRCCVNPAPGSCTR